VSSVSSGGGDLGGGDFGIVIGLEGGGELGWGVGDIVRRRGDLRPDNSVDVGPGFGEESLGLGLVRHGETVVTWRDEVQIERNL
jgi:hypothetical protein